MADSLTDRLAVTLHDHQWGTRQTADDAGHWLVWVCTCGARGERERLNARHVEVTQRVEAQARQHVAEKLAETVAEWLDEQAQRMFAAIDAEPESEDRGSWAIKSIAFARASHEIREEAKNGD